MGEGAEEVGEDDHKLRRIEGADLILIAAEVDACLAAYGSIDGTQERGGDVDVANARLKVAAAKPPRSVTIPPPRLMSSE